MPVTDLVSAYVFLALQETEMTAPNTLTLSWIFDIFSWWQIIPLILLIAILIFWKKYRDSQM